MSRYTHEVNPYKKYNIWVFIAQLVEHCSANAEAMGSNPVEAQKLFWGQLNLQLLKIAITIAMITSQFQYKKYYLSSTIYL